MPEKLMLTGHTGNDGTIANSLESVQKSISLGADAIEVDVRRGKEGALILTHDAPVFSEGYAYPRLEEALRLMRPYMDIRLNCDLKDDDLAFEVLALAKACAFEPERLIFTGSVAETLLQQYPKLPQMVAIYLNGESLLPAFYTHLAEQGLEQSLDKLCEACLRYHLSGINLNYKFLTDEHVAGIAARGAALSVWTVDTEEQLQRFMRMGVHNITTRLLEKALRIREGI